MEDTGSPDEGGGDVEAPRAGGDSPSPWGYSPFGGRQPGGSGSARADRGGTDRGGA